MRLFPLPRRFSFWVAILIATILSTVVSPWTTAFADQQPNAGMMRYPDVSSDHIVFVYAGDLWIADRDGGMARPLASPVGAERFPRFSPNGKQIAFMGNYEGGTDLYKINIAGGVPERVTFHPSRETLCDWLPDGDGLLYSTNGFAGLSRQQQLFQIRFDQPHGVKLPVPYGSNGVLNADATRLAYTPHSRDNRTWKRYRGGMASDIWIFNLEDKSAKQITDFEGTDSLPMWHENIVYYLSDSGSEQRLNIWSYDVSSGERKQVTDFSDFDCKWPSIGPGENGNGEIVLSNGSELYLVDLESGDTKSVEITIPGDKPQLARQRIDASDFIQGLDFSATGVRVAVGARGDIWTAPVKNGSPRNLTKTSGIAERDPLWSPDGKWIAYLSDATGEYELYVTQSDGRGETKQLTKNGDQFRYLSSWSPDSEKIAFADKSGRLFVHSIEDDTTKLVDTDPYAGRLNANWSHDSQWITYSRASDTKAAISSVWIYNVDDGSRQRVTSDHFNERDPVFDRKGEYLYFYSNRFFQRPTYEDLGTTFVYDGTEVLLAVALQSDADHPLAPKIDEEEWDDGSDGDDEKDADESEDGESEDGESEDENSTDSKSIDKTSEKDGEEDDDADSTDDEDGSDKDDSDGESEDSDSGDTADDDDDSDDDESAEDEDDDDGLEIDFDGIESRVFQIPESPGSFSGLAVNADNQLIYTKSSSGNESAIYLIDLSKDEPKAEKIISGARLVSVSGDGKSLLVQARGDLFKIAPAPGQSLKDSISTDGMTVYVDPRAEWKQILTEAWRLERDFFYDPNMHGVDWPAILEQYSALLDDCASRRDVGFLIGEMISELNVGHAYYRSPRLDSGPNSAVGLLGCDFEADGERYKISHIPTGGKWDSDTRNQLITQGIEVGDYLLAINGVELTTKDNPYRLLDGTRRQTITVVISKDAQLDQPALSDDDRRVTLRTLASESNLRFWDWIEAKRKYIADKTDGRVGYIYVKNTGIDGQNDLVRQFFAQQNSEALIIDDRWNGGGQIPTRFIELLNRPVTNYWARRDGRDWTWPPDGHHGPKCMLINGLAGSGGDMFPALFKQSKLGPLIGMRTWGGLVGISGGPTLIDGSSVTMPSFAYYEKDGTWGIEGHGVDPDQKVIDDPSKMVNGGDPQLDAAIESMLSALETNAYSAPDRPAYPDRRKLGIKPEDK